MTHYKSVLDLPPHLRPQAEAQLTVAPGAAANDTQFKPRRKKYGNVPVEVDGRRFPSKAQAGRHQELRLAVAANAIIGFVSEVSVLLPGGNRMRLDELIHEPVAYACGCCGHENLIPTLVFEDTKGVITREWEAKRRALEAALGIKVRIIHRQN
jgi:hypothetical protein